MNPLAKTLPALLVGLGLVSSPTAQRNLSGEFSPNPAAPGEPVTFTLTDASGQGMFLPSSCGFFTIYVGTQEGPVVGPSVVCPQVIIPVEPNGSFSFTWDQKDASGNPVPPGRYWFQAHVSGGVTPTIFTEWFCLSIQGPGEPALTAAGPAEVGGTTFMTISSASDTGAPYLAAMSLSSNNPFSSLGLDTCLSQPIFIVPGVDALGTLGPNGEAVLAVEIPNIPQLAYLGFHVQAVIGGRVLHLTNDLSFSIRP